MWFSKSCLTREAPSARVSHKARGRGFETRVYRISGGAAGAAQAPGVADHLSDRELMDIGTTRGEIDYVASNRGIDPRGIRRTGEHVRPRSRRRGEVHASIRAVGGSRPWQRDGRQAYRLAHGAIGTTDCCRGNSLGWWFLSQYPLYAQQIRDFKQEDRATRARGRAQWTDERCRTSEHGKIS